MRQTGEQRQMLKRIQRLQLLPTKQFTTDQSQSTFQGREKGRQEGRKEGSQKNQIT